MIIYFSIGIYCPGDKAYAYPEHTSDYFKDGNGVLPGSNVRIRDHPNKNDVTWLLTIYKYHLISSFSRQVGILLISNSSLTFLLSCS